MARMTTRPHSLPTRFGDLAREVPPYAISTQRHYDESVAMIDRLMAVARLTKEQALYLETLVQLVQAYEAAHERMDMKGLTPLASLRHLLAQSEMNASDLARLLGVHASLGSKILSGDRSLTVDHIRKLALRFKVNPALFLS
ncbi:MAG: helix-turn-helix domain-containing protein [Phycisphaerae bacterium]|nr:helix-turn-helix domain-containing protein [Phycisphaerae bacterium]